MPNSLSAASARQCDATPDAPFLLLPGGEVLLYRDLPRRTARLANTFARHGVSRGDRIALQADKSVEALLVYLAALRVGAVFLPLNPAYTTSEVAYFLEDAEPALLICDPAEAGALGALCQNLLTVDAQGHGSLSEAAARESDAFDDADCNPDDLAAILYTSGTTGRSKGAMLTHGNLLSNAQVLVDYWRFTSADRLLHALPIYHVHGLFVATNTVLLAGASMIFLPRFESDELVRRMAGASVLMGVPTFYSRLLADPAFTREAAAPIRLFVSGSAPLSAEVHKEFRERTGHAILERYGMTETGMITSNPYEGDRVPGSVGFPLPGVSVRIADPETGAPVPDVGVIEVEGPNVFKGYWRMPDKTAEEFRADGFFITGDLGRIDERGYVHIVGRAKDLIISGGLNVYPAEVEAVLDAIEGVAESAVIGVPHEDLGEAVVAVLQASDPGLDEAAVIAACAEALARFKQPKRVIFLPELPRNAMGKIQKKALRESYCGLFAGSMPPGGMRQR
jgi:malonyl-CoA/methylmalonyl-CoA synthetase